VLSAARADDVIWRPVAKTPPPSVVASTRPAAVTLGKPIPAATLERPVPQVSSPVEQPVVAAPTDANFTPTAFTPTAVSAPIIRAQAPPDPPPPSGGAVGVPPPGSTSGPPPTFGPPPPGAEVPYNNGVAIDRPINHSWWDQCRDFITGGPGHCCFQSDHGFDYFSSPVTNPFLFEDPRALTEVRPIFFYQTAPSRNPVFRGGNSEFFGTQARVAFNEHWSLVMNKLGFVALHPDNPDAVYGDHTGFSEVWLGPKWTFLRNDCTRTVAATGLTFQIPSGPSRVFQDTGNLSLTPYFSIAQAFGRSSYGTFDAMGTLGYSFGVDNKRSDYFFMDLHLDYDVASWHKVYPFLEMNWFHYTTNGNAHDQNFEGADLVNFGANNVSGRDILTLGTGLRYKFTEHAQVGVGAEWPLTTSRDLADFRLTVDFILRY
jgi:hypothetical protein